MLKIVQLHSAVTVKNAAEGKASRSWFKYPVDGAASKATMFLSFSLSTKSERHCELYSSVIIKGGLKTPLIIHLLLFPSIIFHVFLFHLFCLNRRYNLPGNCISSFTNENLYPVRKCQICSLFNTYTFREMPNWWVITIDSFLFFVLFR